MFSRFLSFSNKSYGIWFIVLYYIFIVFTKSMAYFFISMAFTLLLMPSHDLEMGYKVLSTELLHTMRAANTAQYGIIFTMRFK